MNVFHLAGHIVARNKVCVACCSLSCSCWLSRYSDSESLRCLICRSRLSTCTINSGWCFAPSTGYTICSHRSHKAGSGQYGIACSEAFCQVEMSVERYLSSTIFAKDACIRNSILSINILIFATIYVAADFSFITTFCQDFGVFTNFCLGLWRSTEKMFEIQFNNCLLYTSDAADE